MSYESLNSDIKSLELLILDRLNTESEMRKNLELAKLAFKSSLDPKLKDFSNDEKREAEALKLEPIRELMDDLKKYSYETEVLKIELRYKLRTIKASLPIYISGEDKLYYESI
jgi:hypothetical protein